MQLNVPLDYAVFQLSPRRSRCELIVSYDGTTEKLASGLVKPFVTHLKVAEEQVALAGKSIKLDVERDKNAETWFTKGTLERFVRFVSTPEVLEMVNTFDAETSQLEAARKIYSQGAADPDSGTSGGVVNGATTASDATKKELVRAIDVRLSAVKQDLITACSRASAAGFNPQTVSELQFFADHFGAHRLSEACSKFITITEQRSDLFNFNYNSTWKSSDDVLRTSTCSDMSLDDSFDDQSRPSTCTTTKVTFPLRPFSREPSPSPIDDVDGREGIKDKNFDKDKAMGSTTSATTSTTESTSIPTGKPQLTRRLSVQERINLFENKAQSSPSSATTPTSTGGKPEFRRLSSDVNSSTDNKAVLRRWSGVSDMSIDVSGERKEPDSNANTPTPSFSSSTRPVFSPKPKDPCDPNPEEGNKDSKPPLKANLESLSSESSSKIPSFSGRSSEKDQSSSGVRSRAEELGSPFQCATDENLDGLSSKGGKSQGESTILSGKSVTKIESKLVGIQAAAIPDVLMDQKASRTNFSGFKRTIEGGSDNETSEVDAAPAQPRWKPVAEVGKSQSQQMENFGSGSDQVTRREAIKESSSNVDGSHFDLHKKGMIETIEAFPADQVQRVRLPKGNQGVNDELKMKANELEKLFAEHKLRLPADQSNSARRIRPFETAKEPDPEPEPELEPEKDFTPLSKRPDNYDNDVTPKHNIYTISFSDDSRGKLYLKYMQKRDAKLREDWSSNRPAKEAQMKAMHDSLEKSRADMKVKLAGSAVKNNSAYDTKRKADKMRLFNVQTTAKRNQPTDLFMSEEDEVQAEFLGKKLNETHLGDSSSKSTLNRRVQPNKSASSTSSRTATGPITRSSGKASNSATGRRRLPYDNPLAQSVPNFSDLKKENTRPSPGGSKTARPQGRNHARKKSTSEDFPLVNEEKPRRFQTARKNAATTMDLNDSRNSDDITDTQLMSSKYLREPRPDNEEYEKLSNDMETSTVPRKGNGIGRIARNEHSVGNTSFGTEDMMDVVKDEEHDYETTFVEETGYVDDSKARLSHEFEKSENFGYESNNALRFVSQERSVSAAELPSTEPSLFRTMGSTLESPGESPGSWNSRLQNPFAYSHEISDIDVPGSPMDSPVSWNFHTLSQSEIEAARMRKQWGATQKPVVGIDSSNSPSRKDVTRGLKRFLKFGRKNRCSENLADWISATTSEGDDSEDGRDIANRSSEDLGKSRMGFSQSQNSDEGFHGSELFNEQVQALRSSIPTPPSSFKLREENLSGSSLKAPKSFFSLSNFRSKGNDSKPR